MINSTFHRGGGTLPLVATPLSLGGGAYDRHDQHGDARHHRPGVSGGYHHRLCRGGRSQHRRWLRNAVAAYRGRSGADSVGRKPSRGMGGRRSDAYAYYRRNAQPQSPNTTSGFGWRYTYANGQRWHLSERKLPVFRHKRKAFCRIYDFNCIYRWQCGPQQHAAVAGRGPLEARGIGYAVRKEAAV